MSAPLQPNRSNDANDVFSRPPPITEPRQVQPTHPLEPPPPPPPTTNASPMRGPPPGHQQAFPGASHHQHQTPPRLAVPPPTLATRNEAPKTLEDLADDFLRGPSPRTERGLSPILKPAPVTAVDDLKRLETFVERRAWANAVTTANQLLHGANSHYAPLYESLLYDSSPLALQTHQNDLFYILSTLCKALTAMGSVDELQRELQSWKFLHFQNKGDAVHQSIPWSLHITAAAASRNLDALWAIRTAIVSTQIQDGQVQDGDQQKALMMVENSIANAAGSDWRLVLAALERMLRLSKDRSVEILSRQGRALLQAGAVKEARIIFDRAAQEQQRTPERPLDQAQIFVNSGLLQFSEGSYEESWGSLKSATQILRTMMYGRGEGDKAASECTDLYGEAVNNMAVAALYLCRLDDALQLMETLVREDVTHFLTDRVATNLCTLYELASDSNVSSRKKKVLQLIAKRFSLHDIKAECFRINQ